MKTPTNAEFIFNWPLKATKTTKNEYMKRGNDESRLGFHKDRKSSLENTKSKITKIYNTSQNSKNITKKYNKLLAKANQFTYDMNKTISSHIVPKKLSKLQLFTFVLLFYRLQKL